MRTFTPFFVWALSAALVFTGCNTNKDDEPIDDPAGTVTYSINYTTGSNHIILYQGPDLHITNVQRFCQSRLGIGDASMNFSFTSIVALDYNIVEWLAISPGMGGELVDIGEVRGLAEVTEVPTVGWVTTSAVQAGHGYVCRVRAAWDYPAATELPYIYARVYVDSYLHSTSGGIIGAKVKYQFPYVL